MVMYRLRREGRLLWLLDLVPCGSVIVIAATFIRVTDITDHRLIELWTKRHFRCDCPTTSKDGAEPGIGARCSLIAPDQQPQERNGENRYTHNFKGEFCRCGRDYDPETETEAMIHCIDCEVSHSVIDGC